MTAIVVNGESPFGGMTNAAITKLIEAIDELHRVNLAVAQAKAGITDANLQGAACETGSNFGVVPSATAGEQGLAWSYALGVLDANLQTFLAANQGSITALDNG